MRAVLVLALAASLVTFASAATVDPTEVWKPMHSFIGTWRATRPANGGNVKVTRVYASASTNHHLEITEKSGGNAQAVWGVVSFDPARQALILRHFAPDGSASDVALDTAASTEDQLIFASPETETTRTRITYSRSGWNAFVEKVELAGASGTFAVVSETQFERKN